MAIKQGNSPSHNAVLSFYFKPAVNSIPAGPPHVLMPPKKQEPLYRHWSRWIHQNQGGVGFSRQQPSAQCRQQFQSFSYLDAVPYSISVTPTTPASVLWGWNCQLLFVKLKRQTTAQRHFLHKATQTCILQRLQRQLHYT